MRPIVTAGPDKPIEVFGTEGDDTIIVNVRPGETVVVVPGSGDDVVRINGAEGGTVIIYDAGFSGHSGDDTYILNGGDVTLVYDVDPFLAVQLGDVMNFGHDRIQGFTPGTDFLDMRGALLGGLASENTLEGETVFGDLSGEHVIVDAINMRDGVDYFM